MTSTDESSEAVIEYRAIRYLHLLVRDAAADSLQQLLSNNLEWRTEAPLATLRTKGSDVTVPAPVTWEDWVNALFPT